MGELARHKPPAVAQAPYSVESMPQLEGLIPKPARRGAKLARRGSSSIDGIRLNFTPLSAAKIRQRWDKLKASDKPRDRESLKNLMLLVRVLLRIVGESKKNNTSIAAAALELGSHSRVAAETACKELLEQHRPLERAIRSVDLYFENQGPLGRAYFEGRTHGLVIPEGQLSTAEGQARLDAVLAHRSSRPDTRDAFSIVNYPGYLGADTIHDVNEITHRYRAMLITDIEDYETLEEIQVAAGPGGDLEKLAGCETRDRYKILYGNYPRARRRFMGRNHSEASDVFVPASSIHLGRYMAQMAQGCLWKVPVGFNNALRGVDAVRVDLLVREELGDGHGLLANLRINPVVKRGPRGDAVVIWACSAACTAEDRPQIGGAMAEQELARFSEALLKQKGLFRDLQVARRAVECACSAYLIANSDRDGAFLPGSRVKVQVNHKEKSLLVVWSVHFREVAEKATVRIERADPEALEGAA